MWRLRLGPAMNSEFPQSFPEVRDLGWSGLSLLSDSSYTGHSWEALGGAHRQLVYYYAFGRDLGRLEGLTGGRRGMALHWRYGQESYGERRGGPHQPVHAERMVNVRARGLFASPGAASSGPQPTGPEARKRGRRREHFTL